LQIERLHRHPFPTAPTIARVDTNFIHLFASRDGSSMPVDQPGRLGLGRLRVTARQLRPGG
jgi:hypothetical protein